MENLVQRFVSALAEAEASRKVDPLLPLSHGQREGRDVVYRGMTLIEHRDGRIHRLRAYYDSAAFVPRQAAAVADDAGVPTRGRDRNLPGYSTPDP